MPTIEQETVRPRRKVAMCWELGAGYGHVSRLASIANRLARQGCELFVILKDLSKAKQAFHGIDVTFVQAPVKTSRAVPHLAAPVTFPHMLLNLGWRDEAELSALVAAWRQLLQWIAPDLIVLDHSPTANLASRGLSMARVTVGTGFCIPHDESPMPEMAHWRTMPLEQRVHDERWLIDQVNRIAYQNSAPLLKRFGELYSSVDETILTTFKEFDHYPQRTGGDYFGVWPSKTGKEVPAKDHSMNWPEGQGPKIFAYLKPMNPMGELIRWLSDRGNPTIVVGDGLNLPWLRERAGKNVRLIPSPFPFHQLQAECDLAILNGNHGVTSQLMLAGKPIFTIPLFFEQSILGTRLRSMGASLSAVPSEPAKIFSELQAMLTEDRFSQSAQAFAHQYRAYDPESQLERVVEKMTALLP